MIIAMMPVLWHLWNQCYYYHDTTTSFVRAIVICGYCSFLFGWHVHEKAILMVILPLTPLAILTRTDANVFLLLSVTGTFSLFPLLHRLVETPTKIFLLVMYCVYAFKSLGLIHGNGNGNGMGTGKGRPVTPQRPGQKGEEEATVVGESRLMGRVETLYVLGFIGLQLFYSVGAQVLGLERKLPFLPLLLTSVYCAVGVIYSWLKFYSFVLYS
jgi:alpha-1,3-glucosyltransferase